MKVKFPVDEFLGTQVPTTEYPLTFGGETVTVDMCDEVAAIMKAITAQDGTAPEKLRALFAPPVLPDPPDDAPEDETPEHPEPDPVTNPAFIPANTVDAHEVRAWAQTQPNWRNKVKDRGALSPSLIAAYVAAHSG